MQTVTLTIPRHSDPLARAALLGLVALVAWLALAQPGPQATSAHQQPIIILPTPALAQQRAPPPSSAQEVAPVANREAQPTPAQMAPTDTLLPAVELAAPTIDPAPLALQQQIALPAVTMQDTGDGR